MNKQLYARVAVGVSPNKDWLLQDCHTKEELHRIVEQIMKRNRTNENQ